MTSWVSTGLMVLLCNAAVGESFAASRQFASPRSAVTLARGGAIMPPRAAVISADAPALVRGGATADSGAQELSSTPQSIFNLAKNIVGSGVLALPAGAAAVCPRSSGRSIGAAIGLVALLGALSAYCFALVGRACAALGVTTYREAWEQGVDENSGWLVTATCAFKTLSGCISYCIILGDTAPQMARALLGEAMVGAGAPLALLARRDASLALLGSLVLLPLSLLRSLKALAPASLLGTAGMVYTALFTSARALGGAYAPGGRLALALANRKSAS